MRAIIGLCLLLWLAGCATLERATNTRTYIISPAQLTEIRTLLAIEPCPAGQQAMALTIQAASGGATVTVRCQ